MANIAMGLKKAVRGRVVSIPRAIDRGIVNEEERDG
jgi:hypothetical protein